MYMDKNCHINIVIFHNNSLYYSGGRGGEGSGSVYITWVTKKGGKTSSNVKRGITNMHRKQERDPGFMTAR